MDIDTQCDASGSRLKAPPHVDPALVVDYDYMNLPGIDEGDVYKALKRLHSGPDIVWTPQHGGHWIVTRGEDIKWVQETFEIFSHTEMGFPRGRSPHIPPISVDPPLHARYRALFNPHFSRRKVEEVYQARAREVITGLIDNLRPQGRCEFVEDFAFFAPLRIFFDVVNLPFDRRDEFLGWGRIMAGSLDANARREAFTAITEYLKQVLDDRSKNPGEDIFTSIANWKNSKYYQGDDSDMIGMAALVFLGGQDTVASQMSFAAWQLALNPELQLRLRGDPEILPQAVEELLRRHGLSNTGRLIMQDCERKGARFQKGEMVMVPIGCSGIDERLYDDPLRVDFDRPPVPHNTFGNGPHKCVGAPLGRMELRVFLEEWSKRMPTVGFDPDKPAPVSHAGAVNGVSHLYLTWDV